ncbi:MAG: VPLPA-CTERM sorting domain-containing protein [Pseudomonadota bacterium]
MKSILLCAAACALTVSTANAATFTYEGDPLVDLLNGRDIQLGSITGSIAFDAGAFAAGAVLDETDINEFFFSVDGFGWSSFYSDYVDATFTVNAAGDGFDSFGFTVEAEASLAIDGAEQLSISDGVLFNASFQGVTLGDVFLNSPSTSVPSATILNQGGGFFETGGAGTFTLVDDMAPVPVPGALPLFAAGLAGFGWLRRRSR